MSTLRDSTTETLRLFIEKAHKLLTSSFIKAVEQEDITMQVKMRVGQPLVIESSGPPDELLEAFVLTFRFFIQKDDQISFRGLERLLDDPGLSTHWRQEYKRVRTQLNQYLDQSVEIAFQRDKDGRKPTRHDVMRVFIFGHLAHANPDKRPLFEEWRRHPFFPLFQHEFLRVLVDVLGAIRYMAYLSAQELTGKNTISTSG